MNQPALLPELMKPAESVKLSPMLTQYLEYKAKYKDSLLLFQVGDFYETFFDDAVTISKALNLTLTSRDKNSESPIPMAGVPIGVIEGYLERLIAQGYSVAIVSQTEAPVGGKGMFGRKLERIVTPGVRILGGTDPGRSESIVAALFLEQDSEGAVAFTDVQSGRVWVREHLTVQNLSAEVQNIGPVEIVIPRSGPLAHKISHYYWAKKLSVKIRGDATSDIGGDSRREFSQIEGYGRLSPQSKRAVRLLLNYIDETTVDAAVSVNQISVSSDSESMGIDASTRANLELVKNMKEGGTSATLFSVLDYTQTAPGSRALYHAILHPLVSLIPIHERLATVRYFKTENALREDLGIQLKYIADIERIATRVELKSVTPRELGALRDSLIALPKIGEKLRASISENQDGINSQNRIASISEGITTKGDLSAILDRALVEVPPLSSHDGDIVRDGYHEEVDRLREIKKKGREWISELEGLERNATGISSLKIKYNSVIGFFFEITKANAAKVPPHYIRRQSTATGDRFTTPELQHREEEVMGAEGKLCALERKLFEDLRSEVFHHVEALRKVSRSVGELDMLLSLAEAADREDFVEPRVNESNELSIRGGRHPVLAKILHGSFIPNSLRMAQDSNRCLIITGPNMGGKSTYLRQAAVLVIMAQMGSFVPAESATIGIVDRIFARIGASDNMAEGESTFMVEMREASHILANATARSLLLIDEIGRGTATADGLAIARSILEWLVTERGCRTLFATHYHELTSLDKVFPTVGNLSVGSTDVDGEVVFTHQILSGPASRSYGLEVARLAGLPRDLIEQARGYLSEYERDTPRQDSAAQERSQLSFFASSPSRTKEKIVVEKIINPPDYAVLKGLKERIQAISPDDTSPRSALNLLVELSDLVRKT